MQDQLLEGSFSVPKTTLGAARAHDSSIYAVGPRIQDISRRAQSLPISLGILHTTDSHDSLNLGKDTLRCNIPLSRDES